MASHWSYVVSKLLLFLCGRGVMSDCLSMLGQRFEKFDEHRLCCCCWWWWELSGSPGPSASEKLENDGNHQKNPLPKNPWTLQNWGVWTCFSQGSFRSPNHQFWDPMILRSYELQSFEISQQKGHVRSPGNVNGALSKGGYIGTQ